VDDCSTASRLCGPRSSCKMVDSRPVCACLEGYSGEPPKCRPQCINNNDCPSKEACVNQRCSDPCPGSCGLNSKCSTINHSPVCMCSEGFTGNPFESCADIKCKIIASDLQIAIVYYT